MTAPIPNCPQSETPIRERAWTDAQIEAMRKDAARYRWLRDLPSHQAERAMCPNANGGVVMYQGSMLDKRIDAAMQGATP